MNRLAIGMFIVTLLLSKARAEDPAPPNAGARPPEGAKAVEPLVVRGTLLKRDKAGMKIAGAAALLKISRLKGEPRDVRVVSIFADGDLARQLAQLTEDQGRVAITGVLGAEGFRATKIEEIRGKKRDRPAPEALKDVPVTPARPNEEF